MFCIPLNVTTDGVHCQMPHCFTPLLTCSTFPSSSHIAQAEHAGRTQANLSQSIEYSYHTFAQMSLVNISPLAPPRLAGPKQARAGGLPRAGVCYVHAFQSKGNRIQGIFGEKINVPRHINEHLYWCGYGWLSIAEQKALRRRGYFIFIIFEVIFYTTSFQ